MCFQLRVERTPALLTNILILHNNNKNHHHHLHVGLNPFIDQFCSLLTFNVIVDSSDLNECITRKWRKARPVIPHWSQQTSNKELGSLSYGVPDFDNAWKVKEFRSYQSIGVMTYLSLKLLPYFPWIGINYRDTRNCTFRPSRHALIFDSRFLPVQSKNAAQKISVIEMLVKSHLEPERSWWRDESAKG